MWPQAFKERFGAAAIGLVLAGATALSACQSTPPKEAPEAASAPITRNGPTVPADQATFSFAQVEGGIPADRVDAFTLAIGKYARERGLKLVKRNDPAATYRIFISISANGDGSLVHVVDFTDIVDKNNKRLIRLTDVESIAGAGNYGDPWGNVENGNFDVIARRTVEQIASWLRLPPSGAPPLGSMPQSNG